MAQQLGFQIVGSSNASEVMGKAGQEADKLSKKLKDAFNIKQALVGAFTAAFAAAVLLDKAINLIGDSFKTMADVADQASKAGISAGEFYALSVAAENAGVSTRSLSKGIRELRFMMKEALTDTEKMKLLTEGLGFSEEEVRAGKVKSIDVFRQVALAVGQATTDQEKLAIISRFYGEALANDMLPILEEIAKNPNMFDGLIVGSEEAYKAADELDTKMSKVWHNIKTIVAIATIFIAEQIEKQIAGYTKLFKYIYDYSGANFVLRRFGIQSPFEPAATTATTAPARAVNRTLLGQTTTPKNENTIANSLGASMGNGPTSGVIGVGNNATFTLMEQQLTVLTQIRDGIERIGMPVGTNTDFTKEGQFSKGDTFSK